MIKLVYKHLVKPYIWAIKRNLQYGITSNLYPAQEYKGFKYDQKFKEAKSAFTGPTKAAMPLDDAINILQVPSDYNEEIVNEVRFM
jgi:hypothetical protein